MSSANMGISQLECLQLRSLVGPTGIGAFKSQATLQNVFVATTTGPSGLAQGTYTSPFSVPSGTGLIRFQMQTTTGGSMKFFWLNAGGVRTATMVPAFVSDSGFGYWFAEETIIYNNPTPDPVVLSVILTTGADGGATVTYFEADVVSFGPNVSQT